jgi:hypothetical protein
MYRAESGYTEDSLICWNCEDYSTRLCNTSIVATLGSDHLPCGERIIFVQCGSISFEPSTYRIFIIILLVELDDR